MAYYILTSKKRKRVLATKSFEEAYSFIIKNVDSKVKKMDWTGKTKAMDKRRFITEFYNNSNQKWEDKEKVFNMIQVMVKGYNNTNQFLNVIGLKLDHDVFKENTQNKL